MRAVVVYESFQGNTKAVAEVIGQALSSSYDVTVLPVGQQATDAARGADLLVVGGPTWVHGPTSRKMREQNTDRIATPDSTGIEMGAREWIEALPEHAGSVAVFDTRIKMPKVLTGAASKGLSRRLRERGARLVADPESFLVTKNDTLVEGELDRARAWGAGLVSQRQPAD
ncbi:MAG TPA: flavodoxin [Actinomycetes bacterium]|nr:flavodoxin [Actinomycetes bacterium]